MYVLTQVWRNVRHSPKMYAVTLPEKQLQSGRIGGLAWGADRDKALRLTWGQARYYAARDCATIERA